MTPGSWLHKVVGGQKPGEASTAAGRIEAAARPQLLYAIGDVHGCLDQLRTLEAAITADAEGAEDEKWLVYLGDYIDRGPNSAGVLDHLLTAPPEGFRRICLRGNHEAMLLRALADPLAIEQWLASGGEATLLSYGLDHAGIDSLRRRGPGDRRSQLLRASIPDEHLDFIRQLPTLLSVPGFVLVHAGLRPGVSIADQDEEDMLWIRERFLDSDHDFGAVVVHGHTPDTEPFVSQRRIGIDTGCFLTGRLTALRIDAAVGTRFLQTGRGAGEREMNPIGPRAGG